LPQEDGPASGGGTRCISNIQREVTWLRSAETLHEDGAPGAAAHSLGGRGTSLKSKRVARRGYIGHCYHILSDCNPVQELHARTSSAAWVLRLQARQYCGREEGKMFVVVLGINGWI